MTPKILSALLLTLAMTPPVKSALPATPLEPVYHALFSQQDGQAWQQLINLWPQMSSATHGDRRWTPRCLANAAMTCR